MFVYEKKLQYPVRIANPNPKLAAFIISQYGGAGGGVGAPRSGPAGRTESGEPPCGISASATPCHTRS